MTPDKALSILTRLKKDGYTIEELTDMLPNLGITIEILEELAR